MPTGHEEKHSTTGDQEAKNEGMVTPEAANATQDKTNKGGPLVVGTYGP